MVPVLSAGHGSLIVFQHSLKLISQTGTRMDNLCRAKAAQLNCTLILGSAGEGGNDSHPQKTMKKCRLSAFILGLAAAGPFLPRKVTLDFLFYVHVRKRSTDSLCAGRSLPVAPLEETSARSGWRLVP